MDVGGGAALINIDDLKMDSPDVHSISFTNSDSLMRDGDIGVQLEGDIITKSSAQTSSQEGEFNTLDEPVLETIKRDLNAIGNKIWNALLPMKNPKYLLLEWDLWGILFFATYIGVILQQMNSQDPQASQFTQVILCVCLGTAGVTYSHVVMLRTKTSIFQYISVLGYCLAPMAASVTITYVTGFLFGKAFWLRFLLFLVSTGWSVYATSLIFKTRRWTHQHSLPSSPSGRLLCHHWTSDFVPDTCNFLLRSYCSVCPCSPSNCSASSTDIGSPVISNILETKSACHCHSVSPI